MQASSKCKPVSSDYLCEYFHGSYTIFCMAHARITDCLNFSERTWYYSNLADNYFVTRFPLSHIRPLFPGLPSIVLFHFLYMNGLLEKHRNICSRSNADFEVTMKAGCKNSNEKTWSERWLG